MNRLKFLSVFAISLALSLAAAVPARSAGYAEEAEGAEGTDLVLTVDISASMYYPWVEDGGFRAAVSGFILNAPANVSTVSLIMFNKNIIHDQTVFKLPCATPNDRESAARNITRRLDEQFGDTKAQSLGTNIGGAMTASARVIGAGRSDKPVIMVLVTDAWNSASTTEEYPEREQEMLRYFPDELFFFAVELDDPRYIDNYIDKAKEMHVDLGKISSQFGGSVHTVTQLSQIGQEFEALGQEIAAIPLGEAEPEPEPQPEDPAETPPPAVSEVDNIGVGITTNDIGAGVLAGSNLRVRAQLLGAGGGALSDDALYGEYEAILCIRHENDTRFLEQTMTQREGYYTVFMELSFSGSYEFYVRIYRLSDSSGAESERLNVTAHDRVVINELEFEDIPRFIEPGASQEDGYGTLRLRARFAPPGYGPDISEEIYGLYYNEYQAVAYIIPSGSEEYAESFLMETDGTSYFLDVTLDGDGVYAYRVDIYEGEDRETALMSKNGWVLLFSGFYRAITAVSMVLAVLFSFLTVIILWKKKHADFIITLSDTSGKHNVLVIRARLFSRFKTVSLRKLLAGKKKSGVMEVISGESAKRQEDLLDALRAFAAKNSAKFKLRSGGSGYRDEKYSLSPGRSQSWNNQKVGTGEYDIDLIYPFNE